MLWDDAMAFRNHEVVVDFTSAWSLPYLFGVVIYCYEGIGMILPIEASMAQPDAFGLGADDCHHGHYRPLPDLWHGALLLWWGPGLCCAVVAIGALEGAHLAMCVGHIALRTALVFCLEGTGLYGTVMSRKQRLALHDRARFLPCHSQIGDKASGENTEDILKTIFFVFS